MSPAVPQPGASLEPLEARQLMSVSYDDQGWTVVTPSSDTRVVYVSSSSGSDSNSGLSPASPVQSLGKATSLLRAGMPDWILLKANDVWNGEGMWVNVPGRSQQEPLLISSYGTGNRPLLINGIIQINADNVAVTSLHLQGPGKFNSPNLEGIELTWNQHRRDLLFEDLRIEGYKVGMNLRLGEQVTVRRSTIHDNALIGLATNDGAHQIIEENVIDNNGVNDGTNHNIYKGPRTTDVIVRNNIISRGGNYGLKWRAPSDGGEIYGNLFVGNRNDLAIHLDTEDSPSLLNENIRILDNVFVASGRNDQQNPIFIAHASNVLIKGNLIANMDATPYGQAIRLSSNLAAPNSLTDIRITGNTIANFTGTGIGLMTEDYARVQIDQNTFQNLTRHLHSIRATFRAADLGFADNTYDSAALTDQWFEFGYHNYLGLDSWSALSGETGAQVGPVQFPDSGRTTATYNGSLGQTATHAAFMSEAVLQSRFYWRPEYTARSVVDYVREGFGLAPITQVMIVPLGAPVTTEAGGATTYSIALNRQPSADVTIPVSSSDTTEGTVSVTSLIFTPDNWNVPQIISITGMDDTIVDGDRPYRLVLGAAQSADSHFASLDAADVALTNLNDDLDTTAPEVALSYGGFIKMIRSSSVYQKTGYKFTVHYTDDVAFDAASFQTGNLLITGPDGYNQLPTYVSSNVQSDGSVLAVYRFNPPGGTWDTGDNAYYRLKPGPTPATDASGNSAVARTTGSMIVYITTEPEQPQLSVALAASAVTSSTIIESSDAYTFEVTYLPDEYKMKTRSISDGDIKVVNNLGYKAIATLVGRSRGDKPGSIVARYRIVPPGGSWNSSDNTTYTVKLLRRQVRDIDGNYVPGGKLGKFRVNVLASGGVAITPEAAESTSFSPTSLEYSSMTDELFNSRTRILDAA